MLQRRKRLLKRDPDAAAPFVVGVTPPVTCEPMYITFNTKGGKPPYTIFIAFDNWYATTVSLPEGYADNDVDIWLYSFNVPVFAGGPPKSSTTPRNIVVVGDSTGALLNSSSFQTVEQKDTSCENVKGTLDFFFYTDVDTSVCQSVGVHWEPNNVTNWKAPMDLFVVPERQPPIHVPVANPNDMTINYTLALEPGTGFLFTMTDLGGSGGVSGWNVAGASEYIGSECLQSNSPYTNAMPSPTATLSNVRMPDYTGTISSTVTSDGVISTITSIEKVENGSVASGNDLSNGGIAGLSIGIAAFAAIVAALISWCVWRRRHGRGVVFWDLPDDADGMLSKGEARGPIDRRFLKEQGARQASLQSSITAPMLPLSPTTDSSEERDRRISVLAPSESSYVDSPFETFDANGQRISPHSTRGSARASVWSTRPRSRGDSNYYSDRSAFEMQSYTDLSTSPPSMPEHSMIRQGSDASFQDPFSTGPNSSARSYAPLMGSQTGAESVRSNSAGGASQGQSAPYPASHRGSSWSNRSDATFERPQRRAPDIVQHSDAGLLMDDSLENEEVLDQIELPPQYHQLPPPARTRQQSTQELDVSTGSSLQGSVSSPVENGEEAEDESAFWRSPPSRD